MLLFFRSRLVAACIAILALGIGSAAYSQNPADSSEDPSASVGQERILLVLPFDNLTNPAATLSSAPPATSSPGQAPASSPTPVPANLDSANLEWIREAAPEVLNSRFSHASDAQEFVAHLRELRGPQ